MTPEQINTKIAEVLGFTDIHNPGRGDKLFCLSPKTWEQVEWYGLYERNGRNDYMGLPRFTTNLNAMHEAEKVLADPQTDTYLDMLAQVCGHQYKPGSERNEHLFWCWNATASQRAEAFLRALNKWEDPNA